MQKKKTFCENSDKFVAVLLKMTCSCIYFLFTKKKHFKPI